VPGDQEPFEARELPNDKLSYDPRNVKGAKATPAAPQPSAFADLKRPLEPVKEQGREVTEQSPLPPKYDNASRQDGLPNRTPYLPNGGPEAKPKEQTLLLSEVDNTVPSSDIHIGG
jgi:hypothetical protein